MNLAPQQHDVATPPTCCTHGTKPGTFLQLGGLASWVGIALAAAFVGYGLGTTQRSNPSDSESLSPPPFPAILDASAAVSSDRFSIATGLVSDEAEGFFVLDHSTGILQCRVFSPRSEGFAAAFTANIGESLGAGGKGGSFLMVTGTADMTRGRRGTQLAPTLVYVLNTATGNYAAFAIPFDRQAVATGRPQGGVLLPMGIGTAAVIPQR